MDDDDNQFCFFASFSLKKAFPLEMLINMAQF